MKALVVDDSRATRTILRNALKEEGFEVFEAGDGRQALEELKKIGAADLALIVSQPIFDDLPVLSPADAACVGATLHAEAGAHAARRVGEAGCTMQDLAGALGAVWRRWRR